MQKNVFTLHMSLIIFMGSYEPRMSQIFLGKITSFYRKGLWLRQGFEF